MTGHQHEQRHAAALFEREREIAAAERAVDSFCGHAAAGDAPLGGLLLYSGEAGLGKTALLTEVRRIAMERGHCTVLSARGSESVRSVPFHVVRQLLQPAIAPMSAAARKDLFGAWYDIAGPALGVAPPGEGQPDPQGVRDGIDWVITRLARNTAPLVLVIDDAHWADGESLAWLTSFAVRLPELPLLVVVSYRPDELPEHDPAFADLVGGRDARPVVLRELTPAAVADLVRATLGDGADAPFCREVWAVTGGNPYETVELIAKARDRAIEPVEERAALLYELGCSTLLTSPHTTIGHLREALALPDLPEELRVDAAYRLSQAYGHNSQLPEAAEVVAVQAARTPNGPGLMRLQVAHCLWKSMRADDADSFGRTQRIADVADRLDGGCDAERALLALRAFEGMLRGEDALRVTEVNDRALVDGRLAPGMGWTNTEWGFEIPSIICLTFAYTDRLDHAEELSSEAVRAFEISGWSGAHLAFAHDLAGLVRRRRGSLAEAETFLREGLRLAGRLGPGLPVQWDGTCLLIDTLLARGHVAEAQAVAEANSFRAPYSPAVVMPDAACLAGRLLLARGRRAEAVTELEAAGRKLAERGRNNTLWAPWALDLADALADDDPERARTLSAQAVQHAARFGTDTAIGEALRRASALAEGGRALSMLESAVGHLRRSPSRYEYAAALVDHGAALRRDGQCGRAADRLREGLGLAEECGADGVAKKAREELAAVGL